MPILHLWKKNMVELHGKIFPPWLNVYVFWGASEGLSPKIVSSLLLCPQVLISLPVSVLALGTMHVGTQKPFAVSDWGSCLGGPLGSVAFFSPRPQRLPVDYKELFRQDLDTEQILRQRTFKSPEIQAWLSVQLNWRGFFESRATLSNLGDPFF